MRDSIPVESWISLVEPLALEVASGTLTASPGSIGDVESRRLYLATLLHHLGETDLATVQLRRYVENNISSFIAIPNFINRFCDVAVSIGALDAVQHLFSRLWNVKCVIALTPSSDHGAGPGVTWLRFLSEGMSVTFSDAIIEHPFRSLLIGNWVQSMPIFVEASAYPATRNQQIAINVEDFGEREGASFCEYRPGFTLIADPVFMSSNAYSEYRAHYERHPVSWADRKDIVIWRGNTTGCYDVSGAWSASWRDLPRVKLCQIALQSEIGLDAGITSVCQSAAEATSDLVAMGVWREFMPWQDLIHYKFQIDIDGNSNSWPGLFIKLLTGSAVLKVASPLNFKQWYYERMQPWVHFIPVQADMGDLVEKIGWARANDDLARQIGQRGRELALSLTRESEITACAHRVASRFATVAPRTG